VLFTRDFFQHQTTNSLNKTTTINKATALIISYDEETLISSKLDESLSIAISNMTQHKIAEGTIRKILQRHQKCGKVFI
jgi:hypothetical protein